MNYTLVILGVILLIVIYILYKAISEKGKVVSKKVDLSVSNGSIGYSTLTNPKSSRYYFSLWVYVENLQTSADTEIVKVLKGTDPYFELFVSNQTELKYKLATGTYMPGATVTNEIMPNFPLQKWVCIMFSVDNKIIDLYIDGKLIRSQTLDVAPVPTSGDFDVQYGSCGDQCKVYIAKFERVPQPMDPSTAWNKYMEGNGGNYFSKLLSSYGATFTLTKDDLDLRQFTLF